MKKVLLLFLAIIGQQIYSQNPASLTIPTISLGSHYIIESGANLRTAPSQKADIVKQLKQGEKVEVVEVQPEWLVLNEISSYWYKVRHGNIGGYIWGGLLSAGGLQIRLTGSVKFIEIYYRFSGSAKYSWLSNPAKDLFILVDGQTIQLPKMILQDYVNGNRFCTGYQIHTQPFDDYDYLILEVQESFRESDGILHKDLYFLSLSNKKITKFLESDDMIEHSDDGRELHWVKTIVSLSDEKYEGVFSIKTDKNISNFEFEERSVITRYFDIGRDGLPVTFNGPR
ncbi:SH3 domain-containing protein [Armatimonadetes bacterium]|nr:SH3 domain-containing protein [bacterium]